MVMACVYKIFSVPLEGSEHQAGYLPDCKSVFKVDLPPQTAQLVLDSDFKELNCFHMSSMRMGSLIFP
ncbi:hypothetical protein ACRRTK_017094 [Alexandromys fortis]